MAKQLDEYSREELVETVRALRRQKRFGMVWEDKPENVVTELLTHIPVLAEVPERAMTGAEGPTHLLLEGDNYHSLTCLQYTHAGAVDVIYIDPPYNTGNKDFIYNDHYVDPEDPFRHSKWLSFMNRRLRLAKTLLAETGMLFISIDDNEQAHLKLLCDAVFGEDNFINTITVKTKASAGASGGGEDKRLKKNNEYLLFYAKNKELLKYKTQYKSTRLMDVIADKRDEGKQFEYTKALISKGKREYVTSTIDGAGNEIKIYRHSHYTVKSIKELMAEDGIGESEAYFKYFDRVFRGTNAQTSIRTRVMEAMPGDDGLLSIEYVPRTGKNRGQLTTSYYIGQGKDLFVWLSDTATKGKREVFKREKLGTLWDNLSWNGIAKEGGVVFSNGKKPLAFIRTILKHHPNPNATVLDFFAGSGTTAQAVMQLNAEDDGQRTAIICTTNENNIAETITYKRIQNVIKGFGLTAGLPANLRYFRTELVPKAETDDGTRLAVFDHAMDLVRVREKAYELVADKEAYQLFSGQNDNIAIVSDPYSIVEVVAEIAEGHAGKPVKLYVFSYSNYTYGDDIPETGLQYETIAIPESILEVYQRVLPRRSESND